MIWDKILDYCREKQIWVEKSVDVKEFITPLPSNIDIEKYIKDRDSIGGIRLYGIDKELSIISHPGSYGGLIDKFEIMGIGNNVIGYLSAEEVIEYIKEWNK